MTQPKAPLPLTPEVGPALLVEGVVRILQDQRLTARQRLELAERIARKIGELYGPHPSPRGEK